MYKFRTPIVLLLPHVRVKKFAIVVDVQKYLNIMRCRRPKKWTNAHFIYRRALDEVDHHHDDADSVACGIIFNMLRTHYNIVAVPGAQVPVKVKRIAPERSDNARRRV